ncbi:BLUF domain-containing protein [Maricaulis sp.]|uniref:BLUF domain-containing protein n=1 Tax=Maricaulis sp. TaxID=1486257 RepID=UPI0025B89415|nr:BLUF domain-containing protein [Maricaulis sp.]
MFLTRLIYFSRANREVDMDIDQILETARRKNKADNITGALWFDGSWFLQTLEGSRSAISRTYHRICADPRHNAVQLVSCDQVTQRAFHVWSMAYFADNEQNRGLVSKYSGNDKFNPAEMTNDSLFALMAEAEILNKI